ncbi:MAG: hypothetical protein U9R14_01960 [Patescibacteria group bacterium]|nr:hypothetical protein [Patescibacteria group bacterium]
MACKQVMPNANSQTLTPEDQIDMGRRGQEKNKNSAFNPMNDIDARKDASYQSRLREARQRAKDSNLKDMGKTGRKVGKMAAKKVKKKIAQGSDNIFYVLLFIALIVDLFEYLDLGIFSALANVGIYILVIVGGFVMYIFKNSSNRFSILNLLKGQLWKYAVLPIFEMFPLINLLPFWTGTVILMWLKVKRERKKIILEEEKQEKISKENLQPEYA